MIATAGREGADQVVDALLAASRAMVAITARSLAAQDVEVTLPQYRALVMLAARGTQRVAEVAAELGVNPSTGTRLCDRLVRKGLVRRQRSTADRRVVWVTLTDPGWRLVSDVTACRRRELSHVVAGLPGPWQPATTRALVEFAEAAGETPEEQWLLG